MVDNVHVVCWGGSFSDVINFRIEQVVIPSLFGFSNCPRRVYVDFCFYVFDERKRWGVVGDA